MACVPAAITCRRNTPASSGTSTTVAACWCRPSRPRKPRNSAPKTSASSARRSRPSSRCSNSSRTTASCCRPIATSTTSRRCGTAACSPSTRASTWAKRRCATAAAGLKDLQDRADADSAAGKDANPELLGQIKSFESSQADNIRALAQLKQDREAAANPVRTRYPALPGDCAARPPTPAALPTPQASQPTVGAPAPALAPKP